MFVGIGCLDLFAVDWVLVLVAFDAIELLSQLELFGVGGGIELD